MRTAFSSTVAVSLVALLIVACDRKPAEAPLAQPDPPAPQASAVPAASALHGWLGRWTGVEGTYLDLIAKPDAKYEVVIKSLDGERTFEGVGSAERIYFERDGKQEEIYATDGTGTGMKWLAGKTKCLAIRTGGGYCRE